MYTRASAIAYTIKFLQECQKLPVKIDKAILFGSIVNNKNHENSDIDLALFSDSFTQNILDNLDLIGMVNIHYPEIDVHTFSTKDFDLAESSLLYEIKATGVEIKPEQKLSSLKGRHTKMSVEEIDKQLKSLRDEWERVTETNGTNEEQSLVRQKFLIRLLGMPKEIKSHFLKYQAEKAKKYYAENDEWKTYESDDFIDY